MTLDEIRQSSQTIIVAGSETTATALSGATFLLCTNPQVLSKLANEVRSSFASEADITLLSVQNPWEWLGLRSVIGYLFIARSRARHLRQWVNDRHGVVGVDGLIVLHYQIHYTPLHCDITFVVFLIWGQSRSLLRQKICSNVAHDIGKLLVALIFLCLTMSGRTEISV